MRSSPACPGARADRMTGHELLRSKGRQSLSWGRGGGTTQEVAALRAGPSAGDFHWRISTATVCVAEEFSNFPGVDRVLCVLDGELGLSGPAGSVWLTPASLPHAFPGDISTWGAPRGACAGVLNIMVKRALWTAHVERADGGALPCFQRFDHLILFAVRECSIAIGSVREELDAFDAVRLDAPSATTPLIPDDSSVYVILLRKLANGSESCRDTGQSG